MTAHPAKQRQGARGGDVAIGALAALIYLGEYLGQGALANKAFNTGSVTALATAAFGTLLTLWLSPRRNPLTGPRFLSVVCYAAILDAALALPALRSGGALAAFAVTSLCVSASGLWLVLVCRFGLEWRLRALMALPALGALAFVVATTTISGQLLGLAHCSERAAWPALAVAATVVSVAFGIKHGLRPRSLLHRARLCVALVAGGLLYFAWRVGWPTPALCGPIGQIQGAGLLDALMGVWRWHAQAEAAVGHAQTLLLLLGGSLLLALLCLIDTVSAASSLASDEERPDADTSRELLATGLGNLAGGLLGLLPMSLSLSRSRTIAELGPSSARLPALAHAAMLVLLLALLVPLQLPLLDYLPKAAIAGALIVVSIEMIDDKSVLLWRAALGVDQARRALAGAAWVFALAVGVAVCLAASPRWPYAVTSGFAAAIAASLLGLWLATMRRGAETPPPADQPLGGRLHFLNVGQRLRDWKSRTAEVADPARIDLSQTRCLDFSAACALADLARGLQRQNAAQAGSPFRFGGGTSAQVIDMLRVCCPKAMPPSTTRSPAA